MMYRKLLTFVVCLSVVLSSLFFLRTIREAFDLAKFIFLVPFGGLIFGSAVPQMIRGVSTDWSSRMLTVFVISLVLATTFSQRPLVSLFGQSQRYTGLVLLLSAVGVAAHLSVNTISRRAVLIVLGVCGLINSLYVFLQYLGHDPFDWYAPSFGGSVTGLLGNPNTTSAFIAITAPLFVVGYVSGSSVYFRSSYALAYLILCVSIGMTQSFLGVLAVAGSVAGLVVMSSVDFMDARRRLLSSGYLLGAGTYFSMTVPSLLIFVVAGAGTVGVALLEARIGKDRQRILVLGLLGVAPVGLYGARSLLASGLSDGMLERGDFWRAALSIFREYPVFGSGLDTYGYFFSTFRPEGHARNLEYSISSSAHNLFLGFLANGGVVLFLAFIGLCIYALMHVARELRLRSIEIEKLAALSAFISFLATGFFVVEHVALFIAGFIPIGIMIGPRLDQRRGRRKFAERVDSGSLLVGSCASLLALILVSVPLYRSARDTFMADVVVYSGGNVANAAPYLEAAYKKTPWDGLLELKLGESLISAGQEDAGTQKLLSGASDLNYSPLVSQNVVTLLFEAERFHECLVVIEDAFTRNPGARETLTSFLQFTEMIRRLGLNAGDPDLQNRAESLLAILESDFSQMRVE